MKNKPIVMALRLAAALMAEAEASPQRDDNIFDALEAVAGVDYGQWTRVLHPLTANGYFDFDNNAQRTLFLLFAAEFAATGDL